MRLLRIIPRFSLTTLVVFPLLVTSGMGLWWRWERWAMTLCLTGSSERGRLLNRWRRDCGTGPPPAVWPMDFLVEGPKFHDPQGRRPIATGVGVERLDALDFVSAKRAGERLEVKYAAKYRAVPGWGLTLGRGPHALSRSGRQVLTIDNGRRWLMLWERRKTKDLPRHLELWLTVAFAALLAWSVWRDRRTLRRKAA